MSPYVSILDMKKRLRSQTGHKSEHGKERSREVICGVKAGRGSGVQLYGQMWWHYGVIVERGLWGSCRRGIVARGHDLVRRTCKAARLKDVTAVVETWFDLVGVYTDRCCITHWWRSTIFVSVEANFYPRRRCISIGNHTTRTNEQVFSTAVQDTEECKSDRHRRCSRVLT